MSNRPCGVWVRKGGGVKDTGVGVIQPEPSEVESVGDPIRNEQREMPGVET
jgi:hypothetical protein